MQQSSVEGLIPYARNAKVHSDDQIEEIKASIQEFGFNAPVLIDGDGVIIAGHGRVIAARALGLAKVPTVILRHLTEEQKRAYVIADNKIGENSKWDQELLEVEMAELRNFDFDLSVTGFSETELAKILDNGLPDSKTRSSKSPSISNDGARDVKPPDDFKEHDDETIDTKHACPKCGYQWS